jgi:endonuclease/exonuclease/phosphatase family metal-dependent hydrolase
MQVRVSSRNTRFFSHALVGLLFSGAASLASAQTTKTLNQPADTQVVSATLRGGSFANKNLSTLLATRASDNPEYKRRALLKFDTQNTIPAGSAVTSALLTVTVKTGSQDASRSIGVYQVTTSWTEGQVTWNKRKSGIGWNTAGGDLGSKIDDAVVSNTPGTRITFDVTRLVNDAVSGRLGTSRYTRVALVDLEASTSLSYREYYLPNDPTVANRPTLKVTYGGPSAPAPVPPATGSTTLRVLQWNTHHNGVGTDGVLDTARLIKQVAKFTPDIVSLEEVERFSSWGNIDAPVVIANLLKSLTGKTWYYRFATLSGAANGVGSLILSRFPIDGSDTQLLSGGRSANGVTINVNGRTINFMSTHLNPDSGSYRTTEVGELKAWARTFAEQRIIAGDFNAQSTDAASTAMKQDYRDSWAEAQAAGTATSFAGNTGQTRSSRIDYIYFSRGASFLSLKSSQVFDVRDSKGVMPSDHRPLMSIFTVE